MWTLFWDMHSGGGNKEGKYEKIYIEAPRAEAEAEVIFYNRFGHTADNVTCSCCGEDYSVSDESESLEQASGFHRNCWSLQRKEYDPIKGWEYSHVERGHVEIPEGFVLDKGWGSAKYQTLEEYLKNEDVLVIRKEDIKPEERIGSDPEEDWED